MSGPLRGERIVALRRLFEDAVLSCLGREAAASAQLEWLEGNIPIRNTAGKQMLTMSMVSYDFRIVTLFEFEHTALAGANATVDGHDRAEFVNMVCGAVNRHISSAFKHIGMSTPFALEASCSTYISALDPNALIVLDAHCTESVSFRLWLCVCVAAGADPDFRSQLAEITVEAEGELDLF